MIEEDRSRGDAAPRPATREFAGPNLAYAEELRDRYRAEAAAVPPEDRAVLAAMAWPAPSAGGTADPDALRQVHAVLERMAATRDTGYRRSRAVGHEGPPPAVPAAWETVPMAWVNGLLTVPVSGSTVPEALKQLEAVYTGSLTVQVEHIRDAGRRDWWWRRLEAPAPPRTPAEDEALLARLTQVEQFEQFFHTRFPGQKRFSVEGLDMLVPVLDTWVALAGAGGQHDVVVGMAHRGRLNVLAHVLEKPYAELIQEMQMVTTRTDDPLEVPPGWTGDAKYHLGRVRPADPDRGRPRVILLNNPSHLEFVNPVAEGAARALEEQRNRPGPPPWAPEGVLPVLVHGDAAFMGEGVVAETLNLAELPAYTTGGTLHLMLDNGLGFTTEPAAGRSTPYAADLARAFDVPIVHALADDPPACLRAAELAYEFRQTFGQSVMVVLHGYRRWGHNEGDDPAFTQPVLYAGMRERPTVRELWAGRLEAAGRVPAGRAAALLNEARARLDEALRDASRRPLTPVPAGIGKPVVPVAARTWSPDDLKQIGRKLWTPPAGFAPYPKLERLLDRARTLLDTEGVVDWGSAEALALATLLREGVAVRLTGQDSERGTFGQRQAVWHDVETGNTYMPLAHLEGAQASVTIADSPLSETAAMGFEYGYDAMAPATLVLWEAQFGDFANVAQVIIDQFLAAGWAKWQQASGLVLLLPHGYDGQGPEHSSARLERYLELSADANWQVIYPTDAAQYYHALRAQAHPEGTPRPLIVLTGKSLFRHPRARATVAQLAQGRFEPVLVKSEPERAEAVVRLVLGTGKIVVDLLDARHEASAVALAAVERLAPWPAEAVAGLLNRYPRLAEVVWVQEEPANMGAWRWAERLLEPALPGGVRLKYVGRPAAATPAEGFMPLYTRHQAAIVARAWDATDATLRGKTTVGMPTPGPA
jgi:2-oxoglutarate dehydrogenase E1 component